MNPQQRERLIMLVAGGLIGFLALDYVFIKPMLDRSADIKSQRQLAEANLAGDQELFNNSTRLNARWNQMKDAGVKEDPDVSANQAYEALGKCADQEGLKLSSLQIGRSETAKQFEQISLHLTANGDLRTITRFIYRVQTVKIPLRITELTISSQKDGTDQLTVNLNASTLRLLPEKKSPPGLGQPTVAMATEVTR